jgi:hypothetical protein
VASKGKAATSGATADEARILDGRTETIGAAMAIKRGHLLDPRCDVLDHVAQRTPLRTVEVTVTFVEVSAQPPIEPALMDC